jgi:DNA-binding response OmpR family regulator
VSVEHATAGDRGTILVVEDEESIADLIRLYLERDGFRVVWRSDGRSGLAAVASERPRLVVLDLMLPGMDGFEVTRALRDKGGRVPVIVVTAREEEADRVLGLELGADDYVTKPFSPRELVARVKAVRSPSRWTGPSRPCTSAASRSTRHAARWSSTVARSS